MYIIRVSIFLAIVEALAGASKTQHRLRSSAFAIPGNATYDYIGRR